MKNIVTCLLFSLFSSVAMAESFKLGDIVIDSPYARSTPPMAPVGGGFMTITNNGDKDDTLISGKSTFSKALEIHEMLMQDGIMKMAELQDGLVIPAGESVVLKPGSYHLMFIQLEEQLKPDERRKVSLTFKHAGSLEVEFLVKDILKMNHGSMDHSKMKHDKKSHEAMKHGDMEHGKMDHSKMKMDH